jgi:hypothetical protein
MPVKDFNANIIITILTTVRKFSLKKFIFNNIPTEIKKSPVKLSLKGNMSDIA